MGRYWNMNDEYEGKFGVALQSSDDAQIFGLGEDTSHITLVGGEIEPVVNKLKELFEKLNLDYSDEIYKGKPDEVEERCDRLWDDVVKRENLPEYFDKNTTEEEKARTDDIILTLKRIVMGIKIASCIDRDGWVEMDCER